MSVAAKGLDSPFFGLRAGGGIASQLCRRWDLGACVGLMSPPLNVELSENKRGHCTEFKYAHKDGKGVEISERLSIDRLSGQVTWCRGGEIRIFHQAEVTGVRFSTRTGDPSGEFRTWQSITGEGLFELLQRNAPLLLTLLLTILNVFTVDLLITAMFCVRIWQVFPWREDGYDMTFGPDYKDLVAGSALAFLSAGTTALSACWLEVLGGRCANFGALEFLGAKHCNPRRFPWLLLVNRIILGLYTFWCVFIFVTCPVAYLATWRLDCSTDLCEPGNTGVATCGVNGCTCSVVQDMSCTPAISEVGSLCASIELPLCAPEGSGLDRSGAHGPLLAAAVGLIALSGLKALLWLSNMFSIYGCWFLGMDAHHAAQVAKIEYLRFVIHLRSRMEERLIFTLSNDEDPNAVLAALIPSPLGFTDFLAGELTEASTGLPTAFDAEGDNAETEPQWC
ncbi:hypothetical protein AK812_SmicGene19790 [Symbiodinium microadriaticum]|uniref:Uncharacterized protein n=1 Tax=Symbiodinium microadriaticum TaxID=2951 RepID=A0A1Q9DRM6_SYMMI|nr:hypothetical protein AK812_SmicGene19790 [Symbiodinium microadriaticum]CAE7848379.1 unnamed protein product [Symbiodinium sp. KB8]